MRSIMSLKSLGVVLAILISTIPVFVISGSEENLPSTRADIPTWYIGDRWRYEGKINGSGENWSINANIYDMIFRVENLEDITVEGERYTCYNVSVSGYMEGNFTWNMAPGKIEGVIEGNIYYRIADLSQVKSHIHSYGEIQLLTSYPYDATINSSFYVPQEIFDFPIKIGESWKSKSRAYLESHITISGLYEYNESEIIWMNSTLNCPKRESVNTPAGTFNTFVITDNKDNFSFYSPDAGNIVAGSIYYSSGNDTIYGYIELVSFHREEQPITVTLDFLPREFIPGEIVKVYGEVKKTDSGEPQPDAEVNIIVPFMDENFTVYTNESGYYEYIFNPIPIHDSTPSDIEIGSDGIMVKYSQDFVEGYRVKTLVCIDHDTPPSKPSFIIGTRKGYTGEIYNFSTYTYDLNYDPLYYKFAWGDGTETDWIGPVDAEILCGASKMWDKNGTFEIKVKAKDFRGMESAWSDPFSIEIRPSLVVDIDGPYHVLPGEAVEFNTTVYGGYPPYRYQWDFGDGTTSNESNPIHTYSEEGVYTVTLTVYDNYTAVKTDETTVIVGPPDETPPEISLEKPWKGIYISNNRIIPFLVTIVIGDIDIEINVTDESGVKYVALYIDGNEVANFTSPPYIWTWSGDGFGRYIIRVVSEDNFGNVAIEKYAVWKLL